MNGIIAASRRLQLGPIPDVPTTLLVGLGSLCQTTFTLQWSASTDLDYPDPTGYKIYKNGTLFLDTESTSTSQAITDQTAEATNTWTVSAYNAAGESAQSSGLSVTQTPSVTSFTMTTFGSASAIDACSDLTLTTRYLPSGSLSNGNIIYTNECATFKLNGGGNFYSNGSFSFNVSSTGVISNIASC
jgi:hypothetical protein